MVTMKKTTNDDLFEKTQSMELQIVKIQTSLTFLEEKIKEIDVDNKNILSQVQSNSVNIAKIMGFGAVGGIIMTILFKLVGL